MDNDKSLGPDGFTIAFFKASWDVIQDVLKTNADFYEYGYLDKGCNATFISLFPKKEDVEMIKDFRLISLVGSVYKIISKIFASHF